MKNLNEKFDRQPQQIELDPDGTIGGSQPISLAAFTDADGGLGNKYHGWGYCPADQDFRAKELCQKMGLNWDDLGFLFGGEMAKYGTTNTVPTKLWATHPTQRYVSGTRVQVEIPVPQNLFFGAELELISKPPPDGMTGGFGTLNSAQKGPDDDPGIGCEDDQPLGLKHYLRGASLKQGNKADPNKADPNKKAQPRKSAKFDPKVKALQDRILAKDPKALPRYGADGIMGPETRGAMQRLGIKESNDLQRIIDLIKY